MISNLIYMEGYGLFVWLSFGIVIISCFLVYIKTKKTLRKYEKEFLAELQTLPKDKKNKVLNHILLIFFFFILMISVLYFISKINAEYNNKTNNININGSNMEECMELAPSSLMLAG